MHQPNQAERPFTVSSLHGPPGRENKQSLIDAQEASSFAIEKGAEYWVRITSLTKELTKILLKIIESPPRYLQFGNLHFQVIGISSKNHKRAGTANYMDLYQECLRRDATPPTQVGLNFISATAIRNPGRNLLFPLPPLIFPRLLSRWNRFSSVQIDPIKAEDFDRSIMVSGYHLRTHMLDFGTEGRKIGFIGYCQYVKSKEPDINILRVIHLLARFSFFSGIGYGTPRGMGQVEIFLLDPDD